MAQTWLGDAIVSIDNTGFFAYALPFMVTFAVLYGILQKTTIFGAHNQKMNSIFSVVVSLMILPFVSRVDYITYISKLVMALVGFTLLAIILGVLGFKIEKAKNIAVFGALIGLLIIATEFLDFNSIANVPSWIVYGILMLLIFGLAVWYVSGTSQETTSSNARPSESKNTPRREEPAQHDQPPRTQSHEEQLDDLENFVKTQRAALAKKKE